jgi:hypothetical protein
MKKPPSALRTRVLLSLGELVRYAIRIDSLRPSAGSPVISTVNLWSKSKPPGCVLASKPCCAGELDGHTSSSYDTGAVYLGRRHSLTRAFGGLHLSDVSNRKLVFFPSWLGDRRTICGR